MSVRNENRSHSKSTLITTIKKYVLLVQLFEKAAQEKGLKFVSKGATITLEPVDAEVANVG